MPGRSLHHSATLTRRRLRRAATFVLLASLVPSAVTLAGWDPWASLAGLDEGVGEAPNHLLVSEVMTGGSSASDEFVEVYNPTAGPLPLEGLELVYVSASGTTITRKAAWSAGAAEIPPGAHVLVANAAGIYGAIADVTYANGLASTGGSVALRIQAASDAIDAIGWGTAASTWLEGSPAAAPAAGHSLERLPGGSAGSGQDTDQNIVDFLEREIPDPQSSASPPITAATVPPSASATPATQTPMASSSPTATPIITPTPAPTATPAPTPAIMSIESARALPDGSEATIEGVAITGGAFTDGGGYLVDASAGIAILVSDGTFPRGFALRIHGELDDRYHQRTLRTSATSIEVLGPAAEPEPAVRATGSIGEEVEGQLVSLEADIVSSATQLSGAIAFEVDDGTGPARVVVGDATGIPTDTWQRGTRLRLVGVVGQRDSGGTGMAGYRVLPREAADVAVVVVPPSATPVPSGGGGDPSASPSAGSVPLIAIADARETALNTTVRVRGVVTLPSSVLADGTAAIQDASGAIVLRIGDEAGSVNLGEQLEVIGKRSTKSGMETILVSTPPQRLGTASPPASTRRGTGLLGEQEEGRMVSLRGAVTAAPRRSSAENVYFDLDDGTGPARVYISPRTGVATSGIVLGAWLEVVGVLGQETSGQQPERGYRLWLRIPGDLAVVAPAAAPGASSGGGSDAAAGTPGAGSEASGSGQDVHAGPAIPPGGLTAPRLAIARRSSFTPGPPTPAPAPHRPGASAEGAPPAAALLLLLGGCGAAATAVAFGSGGTANRVLAAVRRALAPVRDDLDDESGDARPASPLEGAVARLVPLSVVEPVAEAGDEPLRGAAQRSTERILPPT